MCVGSIDWRTKKLQKTGKYQEEGKIRGWGSTQVIQAGVGLMGRQAHTLTSEDGGEGGEADLHQVRGVVDDEGVVVEENVAPV